MDGGGWGRGGGVRLLRGGVLFFVFCLTVLTHSMLARPGGGGPVQSNQTTNIIF